MATLKLQNNQEVEVPELGLFRTNDPDFVYRRTATGIEAIPTRAGIGPGAGFTPFSGDVSSLPQYTGSFVQDLAKALGQSSIQTRSFDPGFLSETGTAQAVSQQALDPTTQALVQAGGAGIGGFQAGGTAGVSLGQALSTTPEALANRARGLQESTQPISSDLLAPSPATQFSTPKGSPISDISGLEEFAGTLTGPEQQESNLNKEIQQLSQRLLGKSAFTSQQEQLAGIPEFQQSMDDLSARLRDIQRQQAAIPVQLQEQAAGRGITSGLLGRQEQKLLRNNAIEALTVSSLIDAAQNRLTSAQAKVDRAVAEKYNPILEEIEVKITNAKLIKDSPEYSAAQRKRAAQTVSAQEKIKSDLETQKAEQAEIWGLMNDAVRNGLTDTTIMEKIRTAKSKEAALALAAPYIRKQSGLGGTFDGYLEETEIKKIDQSPQGKKVKALGDLKGKLKIYRDLVEKYGTETPLGGQKQKLDSAYGDLKIAYKEAANLGALTGPDVTLLEEVVKPATFGGFFAPFKRALAVLGRSGQGGILSSIDQLVGSIEKDAGQNIKQLLARDPRYSSSFYVQELTRPFQNPLESKASELGFDLEQARAEGYSDEEIEAFLNQQQ